MVEFERSFFHDEVIDGFYVDSMMKRCWAATIVVLNEVIEICQRRGIKMFVDYGTLLGAIRHEGFIPWDDDLDILVLREDFDAFKKAMNEELPKDWKFFESTSIKDHFFEPWNRIVNRTSYNLDDENLTRFYGFMYPVGLDVFVMDYIAPTDDEVEVLELLYDLMKQLCFVEDISDEDFETRLSGIEKLLGINIKRGERDEIKETVMKLVQSVISSYTAADSDIMVKMTSIPYAMKRYDPKWFSDVVWKKFENIMVPAPVGYDGVLSTEYGNYMVKKRGKGNHQYPLYKHNKQELDSKMGWDDTYRVEKETILANAPRECEDKQGKVIFFLPYNSATWSCMEPAWEKAMADESNIVIVMPIPWYEKHYTGKLEEQIYDPTGYPEYVEITKLSEINIEAYDIDEIYIQCPFDERNVAMSVHPYFYAPRLRKMCRQLIYIQEFELAEFDSKEDVSYKTFEGFLAMPGVVYADRVVVQSAKMKELYVDYLTQWAGEDTAECWEEKLVVRD